VTPRRRTGAPLRAAAVAAALAGAFVLGLAVGAALTGGPTPSTTTYERTLEFATVTVTSP